MLGAVVGWLVGGCPLLVVGCRPQSMSTGLTFGENRPQSMSTGLIFVENCPQSMSTDLDFGEESTKAARLSQFGGQKR